MKSWIFLIVSSLLQIGWLVSLRETHGMTRLAPLAVNALFGFTSTLLLSRSLERIPMSTAYAAWTGLSIVGSVIADLPARPAGGLSKAACILLILAGTTGLRLAGAE
jgi:quaternary ammonium compound-resistance protein SugE